MSEVKKAGWEKDSEGTDITNLVSVTYKISAFNKVIIYF